MSGGRPVCLERPGRRPGKFVWVCEVRAELEPITGGYRLLVARQVGVAVGWQMVNYGSRYPVVKIDDAGPDEVRLTCCR